VSVEYKAGEIRTIADLRARLSTVDAPVLLLEGRRKVAAGDDEKMREVARLLVGALPGVTFRSGNAEGTDTIFAEVVTAICPERFEYVVPKESMGRKRRHEQAYCIPANELKAAAEDRVVLYTNDASPGNERLIQAYTGAIPNARLAAKGAYLFRDTLKVTGAQELELRPATAAIFYADPDDPFSGGTGHTIRVCLQQGVPFVLQDVWGRWSKSQ
jgi:hypothetical protein